MGAILRLIIVGVALTLGALFVFASFTMFVVAAIALVVIGLVAWACGIPIVVTKCGVKVGYYKWLTFYPYN